MTTFPFSVSTDSAADPATVYEPVPALFVRATQTTIRPDSRDDSTAVRYRAPDVTTLDCAAPTLARFHAVPGLLVSVSSKSADPGLTSARALRRGPLDLHLTAVSRAPHGPAVHTEVFDEVWPSPDVFDLGTCAVNVGAR